MPIACRCASRRARSEPCAGRGRAARDRRRHRLVARARLPRARGRRAAAPRDEDAAARALLARDRTVARQRRRPRLAARCSRRQVVGELGPIPPERARGARGARRARPTPRSASSGLERIFDERLLRHARAASCVAGARVLERTVPRQAPAVRTTISRSVEQARGHRARQRASAASSRSSRTRARCSPSPGIAFSGLQPPGSTFKIITTTGALEAGITSPRRPIRSQTEGRRSRAWTSRTPTASTAAARSSSSFAESCNSVFAPLGAQLGAKRLVATAERFGFNRAAGHPGRGESTIPPADEIGDDLAVGSSAIGQGRVQATALQMATVAATIGAARAPAAPDARLRRRARPAGEHRARHEREGRAHDGAPHARRRPRRHRRARRDPGRRSSPARPARRSCARPDAASPTPSSPRRCPHEDQANDPTDTDAWFAAFAPAGKGRAAHRRRASSSSPRAPAGHRRAGGARASSRPALHEPRRRRARRRGRLRRRASPGRRASGSRARAGGSSSAATGTLNSSTGPWIDVCEATELPARAGCPGRAGSSPPR